MQDRDVVIISIRPKWCDLIVSGEKKYEIRKTKPDLKDGPLRVFIYKTGNGGIIGEFTLISCKYIQAWMDADGEKHLGSTVGMRHCVDDEELFNYLYRETEPGEPYSGGWAWHIDDLIGYDQPKSLEYFGLKRPPQSWQYGVI